MKQGKCKAEFEEFCQLNGHPFQWLEIADVYIPIRVHGNFIAFRAGYESAQLGIRNHINVVIENENNHPSESSNSIKLLMEGLLNTLNGFGENKDAAKDA
jgi:hypothetical protein